MSSAPSIFVAFVQLTSTYTAPEYFKTPSPTCSHLTHMRTSHTHAHAHANMHTCARSRLLRIAEAVERNSEHVLAKAIVRYVKETLDSSSGGGGHNGSRAPAGADLPCDPDDGTFLCTAGKGVQCRVAGQDVRMGSADWIVSTSQSNRVSSWLCSQSGCVACTHVRQRHIPARHRLGMRSCD